MSEAVHQAKEKAGGGARHAGFLAYAGLTVAVSALVGASCCALPLTLAWLGLAGAWIANLRLFVVYRPYIAGLAAIAIGAGWVIARRRQASRRYLVILGVASAILAAALVLTHFEGEVIRQLMWLRRK